MSHMEIIDRCATKIENDLYIEFMDCSLGQVVEFKYDGKHKTLSATVIFLDSTENLYAFRIGSDDWEINQLRYIAQEIAATITPDDPEEEENDMDSEGNLFFNKIQRTSKYIPLKILYHSCF